MIDDACLTCLEFDGLRLRRGVRAERRRYRREEQHRHENGGGTCESARAEMVHALLAWPHHGNSMVLGIGAKADDAVSAVAGVASAGGGAGRGFGGVISASCGEFFGSDEVFFSRGRRRPLMKETVSAARPSRM